MNNRKGISLRVRWPALVHAVRLCGITDEECYYEGALAKLKIVHNGPDITIRAINEELSFLHDYISTLQERINSLEDIREDLLSVLQDPPEEYSKHKKYGKILLDKEVLPLFTQKELKMYGKWLSPQSGMDPDDVYDQFITDIHTRSAGRLSPALFDRDVAYNWLVDRVYA
jgi:hypothetical protein